jgi:formiminoglutamase
VNAAEWLAASSGAAPPYDVAVLGAPIARASISPSHAQATPQAFRQALGRFPTWDGDHDIDLVSLRLRDLGDVDGDAADKDATAAHRRIEAAARQAAADAATVIVIGGDNSLTRPAMLGISDGDLGAGWGLLTLDAHHDVRPHDSGSTNGSPVRELIEAGLPGTRVAQVGIAGQANSRELASWANAAGIRVTRVGQVRRDGVATVLAEALAALEEAGATRLYVDLDIDVLDRAFAPACPASMPGGLRPEQLQEAAHILGGDRRVRGLDLVEVDATADVNGTTVRTMASLFVAFCAGIAARTVAPPVAI